MDTISRGTRDVIDARLCFEDPQGDIQRQRIAGTTAISLRGHDGEGHSIERSQRVAQASNAFRTETVVVADQNLHRWAQGTVQLRSREGATILEALSAEVA